MALTSDEVTRYRRHLMLREIGAQGQQRLRDAHAVIVGVGGIGSPLALYLVAAGVGRLSLIDPDTVDLSNLQRQVLFTEADIGRPKAEAATAHLQSLNSKTVIDPHTTALTPKTAATLTAGADLVIDGVDNFETRYAINEAAIATRTPFLSAAIGRFDGQISLFTPWAEDRAGQPLPCYQCLVPAPPTDAADCEAEGVLGPVPGVMGSLAALEAIKFLTGAGAPLAGHLLIFDGLDGTTRRVRLRNDPACQACGNLDRQT